MTAPLCCIARHAAPPQRPRSLRAARPLLGIITALLAAVAMAWWVVPAGAAGGDAAQQLRDARRAVDAIASRYFAVTQEAARIDHDIVVIDARMRRAQRIVRATRAVAVARSVALYRSQGSEPFLMIDASRTLEAGRRLEFLARANERSNAMIDRFTIAASDLRAAKSWLIAKRIQRRRTLAELRDQQRAVEQQLGRAQRAYQAQLAAAAALRKATTTTAARRGGGTSGPAATTPAKAPGGGGPASVDPPPSPPGSNPHRDDPFLACVRQRESSGVYTAVNPGGYYGAYQFAITTWNITASHAGRANLIGVRPDRASPWDQDEMAWVLYTWQGAGPWGGHCP